MSSSSRVTMESRVRVCDQVLFQELDGEAVLLNLNSGIYFGLDPVGTRIWRLLDRHQRPADIVGEIVAEYDVSTERSASDLLALLQQMTDQGLLAVEE